MASTLDNPHATGTPSTIGVYLGVVQFFFALCWTVYVIYLPQLAAQAGISKQAVVGELVRAACAAAHAGRTPRRAAAASLAGRAVDARARARGGGGAVSLGAASRHRPARAVRAVQPRTRAGDAGHRRSGTCAGAD